MLKQLDMIVIMDLFMRQLGPTIAHKSVVKKIQNKLDRYFARANAIAVSRSRDRIMKVTLQMEDRTVSVAPLVWAIQNKHPEVFIKYLGMNREWFEKFNKLTGAQAVTLTSLKLISELEIELDKL